MLAGLNSKLTATDAELIKKRGELELLNKQLELAKKVVSELDVLVRNKEQARSRVREQAEGVREEAGRGHAFGRRPVEDAGPDRSARKGPEGRADAAGRGERHHRRPSRDQGEARGQDRQAPGRKREQVRRHRHDRQERGLPRGHVREHGAAGGAGPGPEQVADGPRHDLQGDANRCRTWRSSR